MSARIGFASRATARHSSTRSRLWHAGAAIAMAMAPAILEQGAVRPSMAAPCTPARGPARASRGPPATGGRIPCRALGALCWLPVRGGWLFYYAAVAVVVVLGTLPACDRLEALMGESVSRPQPQRPPTVQS